MAERKELSDPCQVPVTDKVGNKGICGVVKRSLGPHLQKHNKPGQRKKWNKARYEKEFPDHSLGMPNFSPPPEHIERVIAASKKYLDETREADAAVSSIPQDDGETPDDSDAALTDSSYGEKIKARFEALWDQVNRDVPARQFAMEAARAEFRIEELNRRYDQAFVRGDYAKMSKLMPSIIQQQDVLKKQMDFLDLTVKNRREKNQLGNDTVSQLISNYGGTLRRMSPEKRETFEVRVKEVRRIQAERIRQKLLGEILDQQIDEIKPIQNMSEEYYDEKLQEFVALADAD